MPLRVVDVFLVERPADALRDAALDLPLDIARVDGTADVLRGDETQHRHLAGLRIDLDVAELGGEAGRHAVGVDRRCGDDRPAGRRPLGGNLLERSGLKSPTLLLAGLAQPSSQTTPSGSTFHIFAARTHSSWIIILVASTTAMPVAKVTREPPVKWV